MDVLEFGSGGSSLAWAPRVRTWRSVEHDAAWADQVRTFGSQLGYSNLLVYTIPPEREWVGPDCEPSCDGNADSFDAYIHFPAALTQKFDLVLVDGRARVDVALAVRSSLKQGGKVLVHDWDRPQYKAILQD